MANYVYLIVDGDSAIAVDPCWDVAGVFDKVEELGAVLKTAVFTHRHFDHTGGKLPKAMTRGQSITLEGVAEVLAKGASVHMGMDDRDSTARQCGVDPSSIHGLHDGAKIPFGSGRHLDVLHTPGHTPGSVCFSLGPPEAQLLFTGDTLFIGSCGRADLPESDGRQLLASLRRLAGLSASAIVLPGHNYAMDAHSTIGQEKKTNGAMLQAIQHARAVRSEHAAAGGADVVLLPDYLGVAETALRETDLEALPEMPCCIEADLGEADLGEAPWLCAFCDGPTPGASCGPGCGVACAHGIMPQSVTCAEKSAEKMVTNPSRL